MIKRILLYGLTLCLYNSLYAQSESDIVITEIFYNQQENDTLEFIEIYNNSVSAIDLTGIKFTDGINYALPSMMLNAGEYLVFTKSDTAHFRSFFGIEAIPWDSGGLANNGEDIVLRNSVGDLLDSVRYNDNLPWDTLADGYGYSINLCDPNDNNSMPHYWTHSVDIVGNYNGFGLIYATPGTGPSSCTPNGDIQRPYVQDAWAFAPDSVMVEFNEEVNATALNSANYSGLGTITNIQQDITGEYITLTLASDLPTGTFVNLFVSNIEDTTGQAMTETQSLPIVYNDGTAELIITEIMYNHPGQDTLEYIEVWNNSGSTQNIGGYEFTNGVDFVFPSNYTIDDQEFVVISRGATITNLFFGISGTLQYEGGLSNGGEKLTLRNSVGIIIDTVRYNDTIPWPTEADGLGPSLHLECPDVFDNGLAQRWTYSTTYQGDYLGSPIYGSPKAAGPQPGTCVLSNDQSINYDVSVFPNPSGGAFHINTPIEGDYYLSGMLGVIIDSGKLESGENLLHLEYLSPGVYTLNLKLGEQIVSRKVVVE